jgi:predicted secreted protein
MELSASGSFTDSRAHNVMMTDVVANAVRLYRVISGAGDVFTGNFQPTSLERTGEYNQAEQFSLSLGSAGTIAYVAA